MQGSRQGFPYRLFFALLAIILGSGAAAAQDMPPILAPLALPPTAAAPVPASPSAQAAVPPVTRAPIAIPPATVASSAVKPHATADHSAKPHHIAKATVAKKHLAAVYSRAASHRVAVSAPAPQLPPGMAVPPPGYYDGPGPYQRLVYGGPPPGMYGGWGGYRGRSPYAPY
jgi:hypothetical protein